MLTTQREKKIPNLTLHVQSLGFFTFVLTAFAFPAISMGQLLSFQKAGEVNQTEFLAVSSDQEATALFKNTFGKTLRFTLPREAQGTQKAKTAKTDKPSKANSHSRPSEIRDSISQFMGQVILSIRANGIQTMSQKESLALLTPFIDTDTPQYQWLGTKVGTKDLTQFMDFTHSTIKLSKEQSKQRTDPPPHFPIFANHFDQAYPLVGFPNSWVSLLENKGIDALTIRFNEFWDSPPTHTGSQEKTWEMPPEQQKNYNNFYVSTRLLPVFISHLIAQSIRIQAQAEQQAEQSWKQLKKWNDTNQQGRALARLCGTWQWTVHNHLNHQDHKMRLTFSPSSPPIPGQPKPDLIIMNGDTIYLKWTFPNGFQEDSLLLSNRDQRLEGTFANSRGPHGNISGKRLSTCKP